MMHRLWITTALAITASSAAAELNDRQQAAFDAVLPALELSLEEQGGEALKALAPMLATCVVTEAKRREVRALGDGELNDEDTAMMNEIMARPDVQGCVAKAAGQG